MADPEKQTPIIYYLYLQYESAVKRKDRTALDSVRPYCEKTGGWKIFVNKLPDNNPVRIDFQKYLDTFGDIDWYDMDNMVMNYLEEMDKEIQQIAEE